MKTLTNTTDFSEPSKVSRDLLGAALSLNRAAVIGGLTLFMLLTEMPQATAEINTDSVGTLETVVVTATRYKQSIEKIPGAITVISEQKLKDQMTINNDLTSIHC